MIDFIFQVDLSTIYIILRRDFSSPTDRTGSLTSPLGQGFYYTAASANEAARQFCDREAARAFLDPHAGGRGAVHGEKDGLYRGGCVVREHGRERFEVRVRRLKARGPGVGGSLVGVEGEGAGSRLGTLAEDDGEGVGNDQGEADTPTTAASMSRCSSSMAEKRMSGTSMEKRKARRGSKIGRFWETVRRK